LMRSANLLREWFALDLEPQVIVGTLIDGGLDRMARGDVPWRPGARELLLELGEAGVPWALVTMSWQRMVDVVLEQLPEGAFGAVVTGDRVARGKPHPEPYLTAADELGVDIAPAVATQGSPPRP